MSYQYDAYPHDNNYSYEYVNDGNHGDDGYHEYEQYPDRDEPDHWEPEHYDSGEGDMQHCGDVDHEYVPEEFEHRQQEPEYEGDEQELEELARDDNGTGMDWEGRYEGEANGYEHGEVEDKDEELEEGGY